MTAIQRSEAKAVIRRQAGGVTTAPSQGPARTTRTARKEGSARNAALPPAPPARPMSIAEADAKRTARIRPHCTSYEIEYTDEAGRKVELKAQVDARGVAMWTPNGTVVKRMTWLQIMALGQPEPR